MAKRGRDPHAKRPDENHLQWRSRIARLAETERKCGEDIVTPERLSKGDLRQGMAHDEAGQSSRTYHRVRRSALRHMNDRGTISDSQYFAALQIAQVAERIEREASVGNASMEGRVDCSGSATDKLVESLYAVRAERAYTEWRKALPMPRRMVIDMVLRDHRLKAIAARYKMGWPRAQRILRNALEDWGDFYARAMRAIDQDDLDRKHSEIHSRTKCA